VSNASVQRIPGLRTSFFRFLFAVAACWGALGTSRAEIARSTPLSVQPGQSVEVKFAGDQLDRFTNIWTAFPCRSELLKASPKEATFRLTLASNVLVQIAPVRLIGSNSLSDLHLIMVDDLPTAQKTNASSKSPQLLGRDTAIEGTTSELQADYFTFTARRKEPVSVEVVARRLGSALDPLLRILDQNTNELVYSLSFNEPNGDPKIRFTPPKSGTYTIELRDVSYRGGQKFFYHLRFGNFPLLTAPFPPVLESNRKPESKLVGPAVEGAVAYHSSAAAADHFGSNPVAARFRGGRGSGFAQLLQSSIKQIKELEPNDISEQATKLSLPAGINGRFEKPKDKDYYEFELEKGERLQCLAHTRSLGTPCDVSLQLVDAEGKQVAESKNTGADEGLLSARVDKNGSYRLLVEELTGAGRPDFVYHVEVRKQSPGYSLAIADEGVEWSTNNSVALKLSCTREGYDGPVKLSVHGLEGCRTENGTFEAKKTNTTLRIFVPEATAKVQCIEIFGAGKEEIEPVRASTVPALRKAFPNMLYLPLQLDGLVWIAPAPAQTRSSEPAK
jgi:hypothetical protein